MRVSGISFQAANSFVKFFRIISRTLPVLLLTLAALALAGCVGSEDEGGDDTVDLTVTVDFSGVSGASFSPMTFPGVDAVKSISVQITGGATAGPKEMTDGGGNVWSVSFSGLPVETQLTFTGRAYDATGLNGTQIYQGVYNGSLSLGVNNIKIGMISMDLGTPSLPTVGPIILANNTIDAGSTDNSISWSVAHDAVVGYAVTLPDYGSLNTTPSPGGTVDPTSGPVLVAVLFSPTNDESLLYTIQIEAWDDAIPDNTVTKQYTLDVVDAGTTGVGVTFGPSITGIQFTRTADALIVDVTVDSPGDATVSYQWTGTGSFSVNATTATLTLDPFDTTTDEGTITIEVTGDESLLVGSTSYTIGLNDFPY